MNKSTWISAMAAVVVSFALTGSAMAANPAHETIAVEREGNPAALQFHFAGAEKVSPNAAGGLDIVKADGSMWHYNPHAYQMVKGKYRPVVLSYRVIGNDRVSATAEKFDASAPLELRDAPALRD